MNRRQRKELERARAKRGERIFTSAGFTMAMQAARSAGDVQAERDMTEMFIAARSDTAAMKPGPFRAKVVHAKIDEIVVEDLARNAADKAPTCRKGCSACCKMYVTATTDEAELLLRVAERKGIVIDRARLEKQAGLDDKAFLKCDTETRTCVFLGGDGVCQVYDDRPSACRTYYVVSDPALCEPGPRGTMQTVKRLNITRAEIVATAAMAVNDQPDNEDGSLSSQLLKLLKRKEKP